MSQRKAISQSIRLPLIAALLLLTSHVSSEVFLSAPDPQIELKPRTLPERHNQCHLCHVKKQKRFIPGIRELEREHWDKPLRHGLLQISCNHCHDINNSNYLRSTPFAPASFENPSPVCKQCHAERYKDWLQGIHGKLTGSWNKAKMRYHCIDCHDPHSVRFGKLKAFPPPKRPPFGRPKGED